MANSPAGSRPRCVFCQYVISRATTREPCPARADGGMCAATMRSTRPTIHLWVPGKLPGLNDIVAAAKLGRNRGAKYAEEKRMHESRVRAAIYDAELPRFERCSLTYELVEPDDKRDPGNVLAGAMKYIEDALVTSGVLPGDDMRVIRSYGPTTWRIDPLDGVRVTIRRA